MTLSVQDGKASGLGGYNRYSGTIAAGTDARSVKIGPLTSTRMACVPPRDAIEARYFAALDHTFQYSFVTGSLALTYTEGDAMKSLMFTGK